MHLFENVSGKDIQVHVRSSCPLYLSLQGSAAFLARCPAGIHAVKTTKSAISTTSFVSQV
jgi:hypothetical protein